MTTREPDISWRGRALRLAGVLLCAPIIASAPTRAQTQTTQTQEPVQDPAQDPAQNPVRAQDDRPSATVSESIDVDQVVLDMVALDGDGRLVFDLRADEVEVREDGEPVTLTWFSPPAAPVARGAKAARRSREGLSTPVGEGQTPTVSPGSTPQIVVFVDNLHLSAGSRDRFLNDLWTYIDHELSRDARILVASYGQSLTFLTGLTDDREEIRQGLIRALKMPVFGSETERTQRAAIRALADRQRDAIENQRDVPCPADLGTRAMQYAAAAVDRTASSLGALRYVIASMGGVDGTKAVLHVSDGVPLLPGREIVDYVVALCDGSGAQAGVENALDASSAPKTSEMVDPGALQLDLLRLSVQDDVEKIAQLATANGVRLFPFQTSVGAVAGATAADGLGKTVTARNRFEASRDLQDPLTLMADTSGGHAFLNGGPFEGGLETVEEQLTGSYELSYAAPTPHDGRSHRIDIRTTRPGVRIVHASHRFSKTVEAEIGDRLLAALQFGISNRPEGFRIALTRGTKTGQLDHVRVHLPVSAVTLPLPDGTRRGMLDLYVTSRDAAGRSSGLRKREHAIEIPPDDESDTVTLVIDMATDLTGHRLAVGIRDRLRGSVWTMAVEP